MEVMVLSVSLSLDMTSCSKFLPGLSSVMDSDLDLKAV